MNPYEVEVFVGEDAVRWYLVYAQSEEDALEVALEHVRDLVGGEVSPVRDTESVSELDFDDVLGDEPEEVA